MDIKNTEILLGIVIYAGKVKEADVRVKILTAVGIKTLTATGAQKGNAKLKSAVQLFTIAEFSVVGHKLITAHVIQTNHNIAKDIKRYYLACAIAEVVALCHGAGFLLTVQALEQLDDQPGLSCREIFTDYFSKLLVELGYDVEPDTDINTSFMRYLDMQIPNTKFFL